MMPALPLCLPIKVELLLLWTPLTIKQNVKIISINKMFIKKFNKIQLKVWRRRSTKCWNRSKKNKSLHTINTGIFTRVPPRRLSSMDLSNFIRKDFQSAQSYLLLILLLTKSPNIYLKLWLLSPIKLIKISRTPMRPKKN